ncbi:MAG: ribosome maturation factor RimM [Prevotella sp.]|jgi:16S rRNA processing protein RimM|nr:ribosome maturation factor RimM [Prevotella sp.]
MIKENEIVKIGKLIKPHGIKGEISFAFSNDIFDRTDCPYLICKIDGIFVPFFLDEYRFKCSETALVKFKNIDKESMAQQLSGSEVYFPLKYFRENEQETAFSWDFFIGFTIIECGSGRMIGDIEAIDDKTINSLFLVNDGDNDHIIPATEDFIEEIDAEKKIIYMNLPDGLLECDY